MKLFYLFIIQLLIFSTSLGQNYQTGKRVISFFDASRNRSVSTELYYPSNSAGTNVSIATGTTVFPVVVFGHGFVITASSYVWLADSLVKNGFIVALPTTESGFSPSHETFGNDLAFLCERITSLRDTVSSFLYQRVSNKSAVGGHSMGGGCSFLAMVANPNINAIFNFAAAETNPSATSAASNVNKPALVFSGSNDCIVLPSVQNTMYSNIPYACKAYVNITNALHCHFANNNATCVFGQISSGCNSSVINTNIVFQTTMQVLIPFLNSYLKNNCLSPEFVQAYNNLTGVVATRTCTSDPSCSVVPVTLLNFSAKQTGRKIQLTWASVQEDNLDEYILQRSNDGIRYVSIAQLTAKNIPGEIQYSYLDDQPGISKNYYRLQMRNKDGGVKLSPVKLIILKNATQIGNGFPNPVQKELFFTISTEKNETLFFFINDLLGRKLSEQKVFVMKGSSTVSINCTNMEKGMYVLQIKNEQSGILKSERILRL